MLFEFWWILFKGHLFEEFLSKAASSSKKSLKVGLHEQFNEVLEEFNFSGQLKDLFSAQLKKIIDDEMSNLSEKRRLASTELNELKTSYDKMEYRYVINEISKDIFERKSPAFVVLDTKIRAILSV